MSYGLKKGDCVHCLRCKETMFVLTMDAVPGARLQSTMFAYPDGTPVPYQAEIRCQKCKARWLSISSATGNTLYAVELPTWPPKEAALPSPPAA